MTFPFNPIKTLGFVAGVRIAYGWLAPIEEIKPFYFYTLHDNLAVRQEIEEVDVMTEEDADDYIRRFTNIWSNLKRQWEPEHILERSDSGCFEVWNIIAENPAYELVFFVEQVYTQPVRQIPFDK